MAQMKPQSAKTETGKRFLWNSLLLCTSAMAATFFVFFLVFAIIFFRTDAELTDIAINESTQYIITRAQEIGDSFNREWKRMIDSDFLKLSRQYLSQSNGETNSSAVYARLLKMRDEIENRFTCSGVFYDVMLVSTDGEKDLACSSRFISDDFKRDYHDGIYNFDHQSYEDFLNTIKSMPDPRYSRNMIHSGVLCYQYAQTYAANVGFFRYHLDQNSKIHALIQVDFDQLRLFFSSFRYAGDFFMISNGNDAVYTTDPEIHLAYAGNGLYTDGHSQNLYVMTTIPNVNMSCYISLDSNRIHAGVMNFHHLLTILAVTFCVLILVLIVLLFMKWHFPILRIAQDIPISEKHPTVNLLISNHIDSLTRSNTTFAQQIREMEPKVHRALLNRFYLGNSLSETEWAQIDALTSLPPNGLFRCMVLGCLDSNTLGSINTEAAIEAMLAQIPEIRCITKVREQISALLIIHSNSYEDRHILFSNLKETLETLNNQSIYNYAIGISDVYSNRANVPTAYQEAHASWVDSYTWQNASVVYSINAKNDSNDYHLEYSQLEDIYQALLSGDADRAMVIFDGIVEANFQQGSGTHMRYIYWRQFCFDFLGILVRLNRHFDIHTILESMISLDEQVDMRTQLDLLRNALKESVEFIPFKDDSITLAAQIQAYCRDHFRDPALSLNMVAAHFSLSESNLSKFFKAHSGIAFSNYIEKLRINQAERLLMEKNRTIRDVAGQVGYQTTATFYNAFRRIHHCTPTQWLEHHKNSLRSVSGQREDLLKEST